MRPKWFAKPWLMHMQKLLVSRLLFRQLLSLLITTLIACSILHCLKSSQSYWLLFSALLGLYFSLQLIMQRRYFLCLSLILCAGLAVMLASLFANHMIALALFLLVLTIGFVFAGLNYFVAFAAGTSIILLTLVAARLNVSWGLNWQRFYCVVAGLLLAMSVQISLMRGRVASDMRLILANSLLSLGELSRTIFSCFLTHNYIEHYFHYEKKLHQCRADYLFEIRQARQLFIKMTPAKQASFGMLINYIDQCYEILQAANLLIYRVTDHATFNVADKEMLALAATIENYFRQLAHELMTLKIAPEQATLLKENIYELGEINRTALQIVANEPLAFVIFIQDLYCLEGVLIQLTAAASALDGVA